MTTVMGHPFLDSKNHASKGFGNKAMSAMKPKVKSAGGLISYLKKKKGK